MPKVRVRLASNNSTVKIEVSKNFTVGQLKEEISHHFQDIFSIDSGVKLSLNKKDEIVADASETLASAGICAGDLVWVLNQLQSGEQKCTKLLGEAEPIRPLANSADSATPATTPSSGIVSVTENSVQEGDAMETEDVVAVRRLPDHLDRVLASTTTNNSAHILLCALHAALMQAGFRPCGDWELQSKCDSFIGSSSTVRLRYTLPALDDAAAARTITSIACSRAGNFTTVFAKAGNKPLRTCVLTVNQHVKPFTGQLPPGQSSTDLFYNLQDLWILLNNEVALKLLSDAFQAAGQEPPTGLMFLPVEVLEKILSFLPAKDLAKACCVCTSLRHTGSLDRLWHPLFKQEFDESPTDTDQAAQQSWKSVFRSRWRQREDNNRRRRQRPFHLQPGLRFPSNPFFPAPVPHGPVIGGDYDRMPQPLFGGGPGDYNRGPFAINRFGGSSIPQPPGYGRGGLPGRRGDFRLV